MRGADLTGQTFGRLTVLGVVSVMGRVRWQCACQCGAHSIVQGHHLRGGRTSSCGCLRREAMAGQQITTRHGHARGGARSAEYATWQSLVKRCTNPKATGYENYGGRGITVDPSWRGRKGFERFLADMGPRPSSTHSIDRFPDNDGPYTKKNCRWATSSQQAHNRRNAKLTEEQAMNIRAAGARGELQGDIAIRFGVSPSMVSRILSGRMWRPS